MYEGIRDFVLAFPVVEIGITAVLLISGLGVPIPEDIPLLLAGFLCSEHGGRLSHLSAMIPLTYCAVFGADLMVYGLGRRYGSHVIDFPVLRRIIVPERLAKAEQAVHQHGGKMLAVARFLPGLRSAVFITAGTFRVPLWKMVVFDGAAALASVPLWVLVGYHFGENIPQILRYANAVKGYLFVLVVAVTFALVLYFLRRERTAHGRSR